MNNLCKSRVVVLQIRRWRLCGSAALIRGIAAETRPGIPNRLIREAASGRDRLPTPNCMGYSCAPL